MAKIAQVLDVLAVLFLHHVTRQRIERILQGKPLGLAVRRIPPEDPRPGVPEVVSSLTKPPFGSISGDQPEVRSL